MDTPSAPAVAQTEDEAPRRGRRRLLPHVLRALVLTLVVGCGVSVAPPTASATFGGSFTVSGYDYPSDTDVPTTAGTRSNNLRFTYNAAADFADGTLQLKLRTSDFPTALRVGDRLAPFDDSFEGSVVVRPDPDLDVVTDEDCRGVADQPLQVAVSRTLLTQVVTLSHLSCRAGQQISVRLFDVAAPPRPGPVLVNASVRGAYGLVWPAIARLDVAPPTSTALVVDPALPDRVDVAEPFTMTVRAVRNGAVDQSYRGTLNVFPLSGSPCALRSAEPLPVTFTAADRGVKTLSLRLFQPGDFQLLVYDTGQRADRTTADVTAVGDPFLLCSVSYH